MLFKRGIIYDKYCCARCTHLKSTQIYKNCFIAGDCLVRFLEKHDLFKFRWFGQWHKTVTNTYHKYFCTENRATFIKLSEKNVNILCLSQCRTGERHKLGFAALCYYCYFLILICTVARQNNCKIFRWKLILTLSTLYDCCTVYQEKTCRKL